MEKIKVLVGNDLVDAESLDFRTIGEPSNEYVCENGAKVSLKTVVTGIIRMAQRNPESGEPLYLVQSSNIVNVTHDSRTEPPVAALPTSKADDAD